MDQVKEVLKAKGFLDGVVIRKQWSLHQSGFHSIYCTCKGMRACPHFPEKRQHKNGFYLHLYTSGVLKMRCLSPNSCGQHETLGPYNLVGVVQEVRMFQKKADETYCSSDHQDDPDCWRRDKGQPTARPFIKLFTLYNVVVIREHTGLGKTHRALEFIKYLIRKMRVEQKREARIVWIVHRRSLGADIKKRTAGLDIKETLMSPAVAKELALLDFKYDIDFDTSTVEGKAGIDQCERIIIQVDSILKIKGRTSTWDLMVMDESESIMRQLVGCNMARQYVWYQVLEFASSAQYLLLMDALADTHTYNFLRLLDRACVPYWRQNNAVRNKDLDYYFERDG